MVNSIQTEQQYEDALACVYSLMQVNIEPGSETSRELEALSKLIKEYEQEYYPIARAE